MTSPRKPLPAMSKPPDPWPCLSADTGKAHGGLGAAHLGLTKFHRQ
eukprot:CAMPEP_0172748894 /NCGR_PEP_ID=MMETSP1074-20121228/146109_1 /TAXON_ID=2916 /ORGANISM="Ceratium fusus, Strain PA161109" /LENGTH=45 /DNA_ID= /DNA_START= /DNA_END= /DNA_ORIENTATION=